MNPIDIKATWHKESYDRFLHELLPKLLAERLPLVDYSVQSVDTYNCRVIVSVATEEGQNASVTYEQIPQPDEQGLFIVNNAERTVVPRASSEDLDVAEILCVGDMLHAMLQERLGAAPPDLPWDENLLRAWLPLNTWLQERFNNPDPQHPYDMHFQAVDRTNWLSKRSHIRRLFMDLSDPNRVITPGQFGRLCPYEKPEGPNMGRIGSIAVGATIRDGRLIIENDAPEAALGLSMSAIPLVEHTDANRLLMGANMMRQWLPYDQPEPALVQTGNEPTAPEFWAGRNMLTAFIPWGEETAEDAIILSQSAAARMSNPGQKNPSYHSPNHQIEPGDKLSNRFGMKGVVSRILPDELMPKISNGTPVELIFSSSGIYSRLTIGQLREAVLGRLAHAEGEPIIAPPFHGPGEDEIRQRMTAAGLPDDGSEQLLHGETGQPLPNRSTAGWVYWGRTNHLTQDKIAVSIDGGRGMQRQAELEFQMLHQIGAVETIREFFHLRAAIPAQEDSGNLAASIADGIVPNPIGPTLRFTALKTRLAAAGIGITESSDGLQLHFLDPDAESLKLARAVPHPWLAEHHLTAVNNINAGPDNLYPYGIPELFRERRLPNTLASGRLPEFEAVVQANEKLARLQKSNAPQSLTDQAYAQLEEAVRTYFDVLLTPEDLNFDARVLFSGRSVLAPAAGFRHDQMGLPDEMAWTLFGPQLTHKLGDADAVANRTAEAAAMLDAIMAESWIIIHRVPTVRPTAMTAFHPVRQPDRVIRIPSLACVAMDADFDGDQAAVYLPLTEGGQREAGELLSLAGHLDRDPLVLNDLAPFRDPMWGLAFQSLNSAGRAKIEEVVGASVDFGSGHVTRKALIDALYPQVKKNSADHVLNVLDTLTGMGFAAIKETGFSLNPFVSLGLEMPDAPPVDRPDLWDIYMQQRIEQLIAVDDYSGDWRHYMLLPKSGGQAENRIRLLSILIIARGVVKDISGNPVVIPQSIRDGLPPKEHFQTVPGAQAGMRRIVAEWERNSKVAPHGGRVHSVYPLARARRSAHPGVVFARAALIGEVDPLLDEDSRWFVGDVGEAA